MSSNQFLRATTSCTYDRIAPFLYGSCFAANDMVHYFYEQLSHKTQLVPEVHVYKYSNVVLVNGIAIYSREDECFVEWSCRDIGKEAVSNWAERANTPDSDLESLLKSELIDYIPDAPFVHFAKAGIDNYGHLLVEMLPKVLCYKGCGLVRFNLIIPRISDRLKSIIAIVLRTLGLSASICEVPSHSSILCTELFACSPVSEHPTQKSPLLIKTRDVIVEAFAPDLCYVSARPGSEPTGKILVNRSSGDSRKFSNNCEVKQTHFNHGFKEVFPGEMQLGDTIRTFYDSSCISGGLGAGMTNIMFAQPGSTIILLFPGYHDFFFWDLACLFGLKVVWAFSQPISHWSPGTESDDYDVDLRLLDLVLGNHSSCSGCLSG